ncbi:MAG: hypothetical protein WC389_20270 [Lutibacter sp.]|jgi:Cu2+-containing amine oxidase
METTITKTVKGSTMEQIFESSKVLIIRHYKKIESQNIIHKPEQKYIYKIKICNPEGTDAATLFQSEADRIEKPAKINLSLTPEEISIILDALAFLQLKKVQSTNELKEVMPQIAKDAILRSAEYVNTLYDKIKNQNK